MGALLIEEHAEAQPVEAAKLTCRRCKQPSIPSPNSISREGRTCLCGDCERATRHPSPKPNPSHFGIVERPSLYIPSELDKSRPVVFEPKTGRRWAHLLIKHLVKLGESETEAKRIVRKEVGRLLGELNHDDKAAREKADAVTRRLWLEQIADFGDSGRIPHLFQQQAGDRSASTRLSWKQMDRERERAVEEQASLHRAQALDDVLSSKEFAGVCDSRDEIEAFTTKVQSGGLLTLDEVTLVHNIVNDSPRSRSKMRTLLNPEERGSLFNRINRCWKQLQQEGGASPELQDAVFAFIEPDEPESTDISEINPRVFTTTSSEDGDEFTLAVWARPRFCWQQSITARNVIAAYEDGSPRAVYHRARIKEFGKAPALLDRIATGPKVLNYWQSGKGAWRSATNQETTYIAFAAMRAQTEHAGDPDVRDYGETYRTLRPCDRDETKEDGDGKGRQGIRRARRFKKRGRHCPGFNQKLYGTTDADLCEIWRIIETYGFTFHRAIPRNGMCSHGYADINYCPTHGKGGAISNLDGSIHHSDEVRFY